MATTVLIILGVLVTMAVLAWMWRKAASVLKEDQDYPRSR